MSSIKLRLCSAESALVRYCTTAALRIPHHLPSVMCGQAVHPREPPRQVLHAANQLACARKLGWVGGKAAQPPKHHLEVLAAAQDIQGELPVGGGGAEPVGDSH